MAWAICSWRDAKMGKVLGEPTASTFCSQGATCARSGAFWANKLTSWVAARSPDEPKTATHCATPLSESTAACRLAALPSTSMTKCSTAMPCSPPRRLMSCHAAREPTKKSLETSIWLLDVSAICATVMARLFLEGCAQRGVAPTRPKPVRVRNTARRWGVLGVGMAGVLGQWRQVWRTSARHTAKMIAT